MKRFLHAMLVLAALLPMAAAKADKKAQTNRHQEKVPAQKTAEETAGATQLGRPYHLLKLSDAQREKIAAVQAEIRAQIRTLQAQERRRVVSVLNDEQRQSLAGIEQSLAKVTAALEQEKAKYKSADPQVRSDALYLLFASPPAGGPRPAELMGKTTREIYELLGKPSSVSSFRHGRVNWLRVFYKLEACPSTAPPSHREALEKGWTYAPMLQFRNGVVVPHQAWDEEMTASGIPVLYSVTPEHLRFKRGGEFP